jgi:glycosyltransferase 2 family protein
VTTAAHAVRRATRKGRPRAAVRLVTTRRPALWLGHLAAAATLAILVWQLGAGPFLDGLRAVDGWALAAASGLAVLTTICCAWRWRIVARGLGLDLPLGTAVAAYYRSLFLNLTVPGGVVGDVHRGWSHGRDTSDIGRGLRAVAWERSAGQFVQVVLTVTVLLVAPSPIQRFVQLAVLVLVAAVAGVALAARVLPAVRRSGAVRKRSARGSRRGRERAAGGSPWARLGGAGGSPWARMGGVGGSLWARVRSAAARDLRDALLARRAWPGIALASTLVVAGHAATFLIAARSAGVTAPLPEMLPLALLVLQGAALPNIGGWGPREGITAWVFAAAGLGASLGVATAVVYGVIVFVASLPGAVVLVAAWVRPARWEVLPNV